MKITDCFDKFSLDSNATLSEVKQRYRDLVKLYHPDSNSENASTEQFVELQKAYETILAFYEYSEQVSVQNTEIAKNRFERIRDARVIQRERKNAELQKLIHAILEFKNSKKYFFSKIISIFAFCLAILICIDKYYPSNIEYEPIQGISIHSENVLEVTATLYIQDRHFEIPENLGRMIQNHSYILVESSPIFCQIKSIYIPLGSINRELVIPNLYLDGVVFYSILLLLSFLMFVVNNETVGYYFLIRYYNLYIQPLVIMYILLGDVRILYLLRVF